MDAPPSKGRTLGTPTLIWFVLLWGAVEATALVILPAVVPWSRYLDWFQPAASQASVRTFLDGDHILSPDDWTGWRSSPGQELGLWETDSLGSRPAGSAPWGNPEALNVLFTGSSMMNGGGAVRNSETIPAFLEGDTLRTLNFATMLFGVDQILLDYRARLRDFEPDVLVVGIDADALGALLNIWVPLRRPEEHNMPFVKPRFVLDADSLVLLPANPRELLVPDGRPRLVEAVQADGYVDRFSRFVHMEQTPLLSLVSWGTGVVTRRLTGFDEDPEAVRLLEHLLDELRRNVEADGTRLILVAMPFGRGAQPEPQVEAYVGRVAGWRVRGFEVVDVEAALEASGLEDAELYLPDGVHLSAAGNRVVAGAIGDALGRW